MQEAAAASGARRVEAESGAGALSSSVLGFFFLAHRHPQARGRRSDFSSKRRRIWSDGAQSIPRGRVGRGIPRSSMSVRSQPVHVVVGSSTKDMLNLRRRLARQTHAGAASGPGIKPRDAFVLRGSRGGSLAGLGHGGVRGGREAWRRQRLGHWLAVPEQRWMLSAGWQGPEGKGKTRLLDTRKEHDEGAALSRHMMTGARRERGEVPDGNRRAGAVQARAGRRRRLRSRRRGRRRASHSSPRHRAGR